MLFFPSVDAFTTTVDAASQYSAEQTSNLSAENLMKRKLHRKLIAHRVHEMFTMFGGGCVLAGAGKLEMRILWIWFMAPVGVVVVEWEFFEMVVQIWTWGVLVTWMSWKKQQKLYCCGNWKTFLSLDKNIPSAPSSYAMELKKFSRWVFRGLKWSFLTTSALFARVFS